MIFCLRAALSLAEYKASKDERMLNMNQERINIVARQAWELAHEPDTDLHASCMLKDCVAVIKELQSRLGQAETEAAQKLDIGSLYHAWNALEINRAGFDWSEFVTTANSKAMKG